MNNEKTVKTARIRKTYKTYDEIAESSKYDMDAYPMIEIIKTEMITAIEYSNKIGYLAAAGCFNEK